MKKLTLIILFLAGLVQMAGAAVASKADADQAYRKNDFAGAARMYEAILSEQGESAAIYYNLGNCYYKQKDMARAVLNYERALLLSPGDADIRFNLEMARSKTTDQITPAREVFIVTWANAVVNTLSEGAWSAVAIAAFLLLLAGVVFYLFGKQLLAKKIGFAAAAAFLLVCVVANLAAYRQHEALTHREGAIIMQPTVTVKSTPNESGTDLFVLHEGTKVRITDNSMKGWKEVSMEDGNKGWVPAASIEVI